VAIREHNDKTDRTDVHVFDQWCHLATVHDEAELHQLPRTNPTPLAFDLDTYRLLVRRLALPLERDRQIFRLD
jgi:DNA polymerase-3 subunit epsilon